MSSPGSKYVEFGALLKGLRIAAQLSQEQLAERAYLSVNGVSALERGLRRAPRQKTVAALAKALALDAAGRAELRLSALEDVVHQKPGRPPKTPSSAISRRRQLAFLDAKPQCAISAFCSHVKPL